MVATDDQTGDTICKSAIDVMHGRNVLSAKILEVSLLGVKTVPNLERDEWSMVK